MWFLECEVLLWIRGPVIKYEELCRACSCATAGNSFPHWGAFRWEDRRNGGSAGPEAKPRRQKISAIAWTSTWGRVVFAVLNSSRGLCQPSCRQITKNTRPTASKQFLEELFCFLTVRFKPIPTANFKCTHVKRCSRAIQSRELLIQVCFLCDELGAQGGRH